MNWKKFLKPDWRKIMMFLIIFIAFSFIPIWTTIRCFTWECAPGPTKSSFFDSLDSMKNKEFFDFGYLNSWVIIFFGSLVLSYIFSCIIIFIYVKIKVKKK